MEEKNKLLQELRRVQGQLDTAVADKAAAETAAAEALEGRETDRVKASTLTNELGQLRRASKLSSEQLDLAHEVCVSASFPLFLHFDCNDRWMATLPPRRLWSSGDCAVVEYAEQTSDDRSLAVLCHCCLAATAALGCLIHWSTTLAALFHTSHLTWRAQSWC